MRGNGVSIKAGKVLDRLKRIQGALDHEVPAAVEETVLKQGIAAETLFNTAMYVGDNDVVVSVDNPANKTWTITASGTTVLFIEYGSGIVFKHDSEFGDYGAYPARSWSAAHGRWLTNPNRLYKHQGWWPLPHPDTRRPVAWTQGNPSANAMYTASKNLKSYTKRNANSALGKAFR